MATTSPQSAWHMAPAVHHDGLATYAYAPHIFAKLLKVEHQVGCGAFYISKEVNWWPTA